LAVDPQTILAWLRRLVALDTTVFDEIRGNPTSTIPAVLIVAVAIFLSGVGGWLWWLVEGFGNADDIFVKSALFGSALSVLIWHVGWLLVVYVLLTQFFRERVFLEQLLRVMGLAMAPLALGVFMFVPELSLAIGISSLALAFGLATIAIQRVTTADAARVLVSNLVGFLVWSTVMTLLVSDTKQLAPGVFLYDAPAAVGKVYFDQIDKIKDIVNP
jgi:hypothetical protein